jgi:hypothetical protein
MHDVSEVVSATAPPARDARRAAGSRTRQACGNPRTAAPGSPSRRLAPAHDRSNRPPARARPALRSRCGRLRDRLAARLVDRLAAITRRQLLAVRQLAKLLDQVADYSERLQGGNHVRLRPYRAVGSRIRRRLPAGRSPAPRRARGSAADARRARGYGALQGDPPAARRSPPSSSAQTSCRSIRAVGGSRPYGGWRIDATGAGRDAIASGANRR